VTHKEQTEGLRDQELQVSEVAKSRAVKLLEVFGDLGKRGQARRRAGLIALKARAELELQPGDLVVVPAVDRLVRGETLAKRLWGFFGDLRLHLVSCDEPEIDTRQTRCCNPWDRRSKVYREFIRLAREGDAESKRASRRSKRTVRARRQRGLSVGGRPHLHDQAKVLKKALLLLKKGWIIRATARAVGVSRTTLCRYLSQPVP